MKATWTGHLICENFDLVVGIVPIELSAESDVKTFTKHEDGTLSPMGRLEIDKGLLDTTGEINIILREDQVRGVVNQDGTITELPPAPPAMSDSTLQLGTVAHADGILVSRVAKIEYLIPHSGSNKEYAKLAEHLCTSRKAPMGKFTRRGTEAVVMVRAERDPETMRAFMTLVSFRLPGTVRPQSEITDLIPAL